MHKVECIKAIRDIADTSVKQKWSYQELKERVCGIIAPLNVDDSTFVACLKELAVEEEPAITFLKAKSFDLNYNPPRPFIIIMTRYRKRDSLVAIKSEWIERYDLHSRLRDGLENLTFNLSDKDIFLELLLKLNSFLEKRTQIENLYTQEFAFKVFGDEKAIDSYPAFLDQLGFSREELAIIEPYEPLSYEQSGPGKFGLIVENLATFRRACDFFLSRKDGYDLIIYGKGNQICSAVKDLSRFLNLAEVHYWGDADFDGIRIMQRATSRYPSMKPAIVFYRTMLALFDSVSTECAQRSFNETELIRLLPSFSEYPSVTELIGKLQATGKRLPQEAVTDFKIVLD